VLAAQVVVPAVASAVMISPTKTYDQSPPSWVGAAVLIACGVTAGIVGTSILRRHDLGWDGGCGTGRRSRTAAARPSGIGVVPRVR
jgi:hypothetical protein